jgi:NAD(P)-dependent dehydrogenase (short-subunit alcohol dehydrogenase family)
MTARNTERLEDLAAAYPYDAIVLALDLARPAEIDRSLRTAKDHFGGVDILVNNARAGLPVTAGEVSDADMRWQFDVDFFGTAALMQAVLPDMRKRRRGTIVNISCAGSPAGPTGMGYDDASKFALEGLTESLWQEVAPLGVRVMLVEPRGFRILRGDPSQAASVIVRMVHAGPLPRRLILGGDAYQAILPWRPPSRRR